MLLVYFVLVLFFFLWFERKLENGQENVNYRKSQGKIREIHYSPKLRSIEIEVIDSLDCDKGMLALSICSQL